MRPERRSHPHHSASSQFSPRLHKLLDITGAQAHAFLVYTAHLQRRVVPAGQLAIAHLAEPRFQFLKILFRKWPVFGVAVHAEILSTGVSA